MPPREAEPLLTPGEVATMFRCDPKTITRWARTGKLTAIRTLGGHRRYREAEVMALLNRPSEAATDPLKAPVRTLWPFGVTGPGATVRNKLQNAGLTMVGSVTDQSAADLRALGLRPPQVDEVRRVLHRKGLALHGEVADQAA